MFIQYLRHMCRESHGQGFHMLPPERLRDIGTGAYIDTDRERGEPEP